MISIDHKLFVTKDISKALVKYAKSTLIKRLLLNFAFDDYQEFKNPKSVSELLVETSYNLGHNTEEIVLAHHKLISDFLSELDKADHTALYFWLLDRNYFRYQDEFEETDFPLDKDISFDEFLEKYGREIAYRLYDPEGSQLDEQLFEELKSVLICFADELDLSVINKQTKHDIYDILNRYTR